MSTLSNNQNISGTDRHKRQQENAIRDKETADFLKLYLPSAMAEVMAKYTDSLFTIPDTDSDRIAHDVEEVIKKDLHDLITDRAKSASDIEFVVNALFNRWLSLPDREGKQNHDE